MSEQAGGRIKARWHDGPYFRVPNAIIDDWAPILGSDGVAVYCVLARCANNDTGKAWMGQEWIAERLDISKDVVGWMLADIVELGLAVLERERDPVTKQFTDSNYILQPVEKPTIKAEDAPRKKREQARQAKRKAAAAIEAKIKTGSKGHTELFSLGQSEQVSTGHTEQASSPTPNRSVGPHLTVRQYKDSSGDRDSREIKTQVAADAAENPPPEKSKRSPKQERQDHILEEMVYCVTGWTFEEFKERMGKSLDKALGAYRPYVQNIDETGEPEPWVIMAQRFRPGCWWYTDKAGDFNYPGQLGKRPKPAGIWKAWRAWEIDQPGPSQSVNGSGKAVPDLKKIVFGDGPARTLKGPTYGKRRIS